MENYTLSDLKSAVGNDGFSGNSAWLILLIFFFAFGGNGFGFNRNNDAATATGMSFDSLSKQVNQIGDGIASSTFALNNTINGVQTVLGGAITSEGRAIQTQLAEMCCNNKDAFAATNAAIHAEGEATRALIQQNKIDAMQSRINNLEMQNAMCGVVRYPQATTYSSGTNPFCGCSCSNI